mmetsp:Transcript_4616/g.11398  ORF Transcript_4616/g.11398 Transcript_4616/m.11398 type:complete len:104 (-) Transcript_4616:134-445(-)
MDRPSSSSSSSLSSSSSSSASAAPRTTPAKSVPTVLAISEETRAIIKHKTGEDYPTSADLPTSLDLSHCESLVDVSALGGVKQLYLFGCTGVNDYGAVPNAKH